MNRYETQKVEKTKESILFLTTGDNNIIAFDALQTHDMAWVGGCNTHCCHENILTASFILIKDKHEIDRISKMLCFKFKSKRIEPKLTITAFFTPSINAVSSPRGMEG